MAYDTDEEADDREMLQQELAMSRERLVEAHKRLLELLPYWEGRPIEERGVVLPPLEVLLCQRAIREAETELYSILDIVERLFWLPMPSSEQEN